jgi:hypothetical protein
VFGAASVPLVHMTIKRLFKGVRQKLEAERIAAAQDSGKQASTGHRHSADDASK